jgi:hypothetical protein
VIWAQNNSIVATFSRRGDTCFGQEVPFIERFNIHVKPLEHESIWPYDSPTFEVLLSFGVL